MAGHLTNGPVDNGQAVAPIVDTREKGSDLSSIRRAFGISRDSRKWARIQQLFITILLFEKFPEIDTASDR